MEVSNHNTPFVLVILDGYGIAPPGPGNAVTLAHTPTLACLEKDHPATTLAASGEDVGLMPGQDGNSEAGHINIGAGRIVAQDLVRVNKAIKDGTFFKNSAFEAAIQNARDRWARVHLMPWVLRRITHRSSGDGVLPKRPLAEPIYAPKSDVEG